MEEMQELYKQKRLSEIQRRREEKKKAKIRRKICAVLTVIAVGMVSMGAVYTASAKEIRITEINEFEGTSRSITVKTRESEVMDILSEQGISVSETDKINISADAQLETDEEIVVRRGKEIKVVTPSSEETVVVTSADTHEALKEAGYPATEFDEINMDGGSIAMSDTIEIKSIYYTYENIKEDIPFETEYIDDADMFAGEEQTVTEGVTGEKVYSYRVSLYEDGTEKERVLEGESIIKEPVNAVVKRGTKQKPVSTESAAAQPESAVVSGNTINGYKYTKKINMSGTAYTNSPAENAGYSVTALGTPLRYGVAAVDPSVIPLGTKLYVTSADGSYVYGVAVAEDTGGGIKGNKIDLCFTSMTDAKGFGKRACTVYILAE